MRKTFFLIISLIFIMTSCNSIQKDTNSENTNIETTELDLNASIQEIIKAGETDKAKEMFQSKTNIDQTDEDGNTALHIVAITNNVDLANFLLLQGADSTIKNNFGQTALHLAIENNSIEVANILAPLGNALFAKNGDGKTSLELAMAKGNSFYNSFLNTKTGNKIDALGQSALHYLVKTKNKSAVKFVIQQKMPLSIKDINGRTPLALCYMNNQDEDSISIAADLILAGATPLGGNYTYFENAINSHNPSIRFEDGQTPLHIATIMGHTGIVKYLLDNHASTSVKDISGSTPLHEAVRYGRIDILKMLITAGADVNARDSMNKTALLILAPPKEKADLYDILLSHGCDPNAKDLYGDTPLHIATITGSSIDILSKLVTAGADCNERNKKGVTPLALAVEQKNPDLISFFSAHGADIHAEDMQGNSPLSRALQTNIEVTKTLLAGDSLFSRDSYGNTPLHIAILHNAPNALITYLINAGSEVNARNRNGDSALYLAVQQNSKFAGELLLSHNADVFSTNTENYSPLRLALASGGDVQDWLLTSEVIKSSDGVGNTPLHYACEWKLDDSANILLEKGAKPDTRNTNGESPLFLAVKANSPSTIELLLKHKANINIRDYVGNTPLHACIRQSALDAATCLIKNGASINVQNLAGKTPLHEAAAAGNVSMVNLLLNNNADINTADSTGKTPLIDAIKSDQLKLVEILLKRGASPMIQEMYGRNAYHEAAITKDIDLIKLIREAGGNPLSRDTNGETPFSLVINSTPDIINAVLGDNLNLSDSDGNTPIHIAIKKQVASSTLQMLLSKKYPVNRRNSEGLTPLSLAVKMDAVDASRILLENGADPYISDNIGECAVSYAIKHNADILNSIVQSYATKTDMSGEGILHYAAREADTETVKQLLSMGLDRTLKNISGETAYDIAIRWQRPEIADLLK